MLRRESYLTYSDQKDANARFYTRVGTPKYLITKPIETQVNIVTTLVIRIKTWKLRNQWKVLFLCLVLYTLINWIPKAMVQFTDSRLYWKQERTRKCLLGLINIQMFIKFTFLLKYGVK